MAGMVLERLALFPVMQAFGYQQIWALSTPFWCHFLSLIADGSIGASPNVDHGHTAYGRKAYPHRPKLCSAGQTIQELHLNTVVKVEQVPSTIRAFIVSNQPGIDTGLVKDVVTVFTDGCDHGFTVDEWLQANDARREQTFDSLCSSSIFVIAVW
jgi:hypothetical protein